MAGEDAMACFKSDGDPWDEELDLMVWDLESCDSIETSYYFYTHTPFSKGIITDETRISTIDHLTRGDLPSFAHEG